MDTWIGLLDCNNFFVSCERLFRPDLKRKPVLVLSSNDGCVVARSQEVKDNGIPMGVPYFKIKDTIKDIDATTFSSHFALYRDVSRRVFTVMREVMNDIEQYSIDEAFFKLEGSKEEVVEKARELKTRVEQYVGIPVSIGLAHSKTRAKFANSRAKKGSGVVILGEEEWCGFTQTLKLTDLWGVGYRLGEQYKRAGVITVNDLLRFEQRQIEELFGVVGVRLWMELQGRPVYEFSRVHEAQKSILHSRSFKHTSEDIAVLKDAVAYHIREAAEDLRGQKQRCRNLTVSILTSRHGDFFLHGGSAGVEFPSPTSDTFTLLREAMRLVETLYRPGIPYKKAGVSLSNFTPEEVLQTTLFEDVHEKETASLMPIIDSINLRKGRGSIVLGNQIRSKEWEASKELRSPSYTTSWDQLANVKA